MQLDIVAPVFKLFIDVDYISRESCVLLVSVSPREEIDRVLFMATGDSLAESGCSPVEIERRLAAAAEIGTSAGLSA